MGVVTSSIAQTSDLGSSPTIYNVSAPTANTEVSQALSTGVKSFLIRVRGNARLQLAFVATESGTKYITVPPGVSYHEDRLNFSGTLYFQTNKSAQTVEIIEWT